MSVDLTTVPRYNEDKNLRRTNVLRESPWRGTTGCMDNDTEQPGGTERTCMIVDTDDAIRRAVQLRKVKMARGTSLSDVVNGILRGTMKPLTQELAELEQYGIHPDDPPAQPKKKGKGSK